MVVSRARIFYAAAALIIFLGGFVGGFFACLHEKPVAKTGPRPLVWGLSGDAPDDVRWGVLHSLQLFQAGYAARDPGKIASFMNALFDPDHDVLIVGTDENYWMHGYSAAAQVVRSDWESWGDLRLNLENPVISSWQDVAWVETEGTVDFGAEKRPVRFSAVMAREGDKWVFRELECQWDQVSPRGRDLLNARFYLHTLYVTLRRFTGHSRSGPSSGRVSIH